MQKYAVYQLLFEAFSALAIGPLVRRLSRARGVIFTLHRVLPEPPAAFAPNAILQITPSFLEAVILTARRKGFDIVDLDEAMRRTRSVEREKPFVVLTLDDAYRDNLVHALPILRKHDAPFVLYVPTALVDGEGEVWWQALEDIIAANAAVAVEDASGERRLRTSSLTDKLAVYETLYSRYRRIPEQERVAEIRRLADRHGFDLHAHCRALIMDWAELRTFADEPLSTLGAHTVHHYELAKLAPEEMCREIEQSADRLEQAFGVRPRHLSYPIGGPRSAGRREFAAAEALGFQTAVTTRPGAIYAEHGEHRHALPRVSLNGLFQQERYLDVFLTGALLTFANGFKKVSLD